MFLIKLYRLALAKLHAALTKAAANMERKAEAASKVAVAARNAQIKYLARSAEFDAEASRLKVLMG